MHTFTTCLGEISPSYGQPQTQDTYPLTLRPFLRASLVISLNLSKLSSMEQFMLRLLNVSDAAPNTAISSAPADILK